MVNMTKRQLFKELKNNKLNPEQSAWLYEMYSFWYFKKNQIEESEINKVTMISDFFNTQKQYFKKQNEGNDQANVEQESIKYFGLIYSLSRKVNYESLVSNFIFYPMRTLKRAVNPQNITLNIKDGEVIPPDQIKSLIAFNYLSKKLKQDLLEYFEGRATLEESKKKFNITEQDREMMRREYKEMADIKKTMLGASLPFVIFLILITTFVIIIASASAFLSIEAIIILMAVSAVLFSIMLFKVLDAIRLNFEGSKMLKENKCFDEINSESLVESKILSDLSVSAGENSTILDAQNPVIGSDEPSLSDQQQNTQRKKTKHVTFEDEVLHSPPVSAALSDLSSSTATPDASFSTREVEPLSIAPQFEKENLLKIIKKSYKKEVYDKIMKLIDSPEFIQPNFNEVTKYFYKMNEKFKIFPHERFYERDKKFYNLFCIFKLIADHIEMNNDEGNNLVVSHAYKVLVYFGDKKSPFSCLFAYIKSSNKKSGKFIHDTLSSLILPTYANHPLYSKNDCSVLSKWRALIQKKPGYVLSIYQQANEIEAIAGDVPLSIDDLKKVSLKISYARADENPKLAEVCIKYHIDENTFNQCLAIKVRDSNNLPDIVFDGESCGFPGYFIVKLPNHDPHAFFLGKITNCCQSIGGESEGCVVDGLTLENSGFYVLLHRKSHSPDVPLLPSGEINYDKFDIVAQTYAWRGKTNGLVFDSLECLRPVDQKVLAAMLPLFSEKLISKDGTISRILIGKGGRTLDVFPRAVTEEYPEEMNEGFQYGDSKEQFCLLRNKKWISELRHKLLDKKCYVTKQTLKIAYALIYDMKRHPQLLEDLFFNYKEVWWVVSKKNDEFMKKTEALPSEIKYSIDCLIDFDHGKLLFFYGFLREHGLFLPETMNFISFASVKTLTTLHKSLLQLPTEMLPYVLSPMKEAFQMDVNDVSQKNSILYCFSKFIEVLQFLSENKLYFEDVLPELIPKLKSMYLGVDIFEQSIRDRKNEPYLLHYKIKNFLEGLHGQIKHRGISFSVWLPLLDVVSNEETKSLYQVFPLGEAVLSLLIEFFYPNNQDKLLLWCGNILKRTELVKSFNSLSRIKDKQVLNQFFDVGARIQLDYLPKFSEQFLLVQGLTLSEIEKQDLLSMLEKNLNNTSMLISCLVELQKVGLLDKCKKVFFDSFLSLPMCESVNIYMLIQTLYCLHKSNLLTDTLLSEILTSEMLTKLLATPNAHIYISRATILNFSSKFNALTVEIFELILNKSDEFPLFSADFQYGFFYFNEDLFKRVLLCHSSEEIIKLRKEIAAINVILKNILGNFELCSNHFELAVAALRDSDDIRQGYAIFGYIFFRWLDLVSILSGVPISESKSAMYKKGVSGLLAVFKEKNWPVPDSLARCLHEIDPTIHFESVHSLRR